MLFARKTFLLSSLGFPGLLPPILLLIPSFHLSPVFLIHLRPMSLQNFLLLSLFLMQLFHQMNLLILFILMLLQMKFLFNMILSNLTPYLFLFLILFLLENPLGCTSHQLILETIIAILLLHQCLPQLHSLHQMIPLHLV